MLALIAAALIPTQIAPPADAKTVELIPTDDLWVYPHASDPQSDDYLRCWGAGGHSVGPEAQEGEISYSYLRFDVSGLPSGKLTAVKLVLTHVANPGFTLDLAKASPLEVRPVSAAFSEKNWVFENVSSVAPKGDKDSLYGWVAPNSLPEDGKEFTLEIDLLKGPGGFAAALAAAAKTQEMALALALTSTIDPSSSGMRSVYKVFSKDGPKEKRPVLRLTYEGEMVAIIQ